LRAKQRKIARKAAKTQRNETIQRGIIQAAKKKKRRRATRS
jgi:hypothetical protein